MTYIKQDWTNDDPTTPISAARLDHIEDGIEAADLATTAHVADSSAAHAASAISFSPTGSISATTVQAAIAEVAAEAGGGGGVASGVTFTPAGDIAATNVQAALVELDTEKLAFNDPLTLSSFTGAVTLTSADFGKLFTCSGTTYTVTLPTAVSNDGAVLAFKCTATGIVTLDGNGSQTIDTALTFPMVKGESYVIVASSSNWIVTTGMRNDERIVVSLSDPSTAITTGTAKATLRLPYAFVLLEVRASLKTASSSGIPTVDINEAGATILSTKLTIDATEKTSLTAATPAVISDQFFADDAELTFDIDVAGTGAVDLKVALIGKRV